MADAGREASSPPPSSVDDHNIPCYPKSSRRRCLPTGRSSAQGTLRVRPAGERRLRRLRETAGRCRSAGGLTIRSARAAAMNRFVSNFTNRLDSKGRVSIPASVPGGARPGRIRGALRPSGARRAGAGCRRQRASERDRCVLVDAVALFGRAGSAVDGVVRNERDSQGRSGGACHPDGDGEGACRDRRRGDVRRARPQVPDLGARALPCALGGGAHEGEGPEAGSRNPDLEPRTAQETSPGARER